MVAKIFSDLSNSSVHCSELAVVVLSGTSIKITSPMMLLNSSIRDSSEGDIMDLNLMETEMKDKARTHSCALPIALTHLHTHSHVQTHSLTRTHTHTAAARVLK